MKDYIFSFQDKTQESEFLETARIRGGENPVDSHRPQPEFDGEYQFANEDAWKPCPRPSRKSWTTNSQKTRPPTNWPRTPFEKWNEMDRRRLIHMAATKFGFIGDRPPSNKTY